MPEPTLSQRARELRQIAEDMRYAVAGGMSWISVSEADEFTGRIERIADAIESAGVEALRHPSVACAAEFLVERFRNARCDSEAVADCVRCSAFFLANKVLDVTRSLTPGHMGEARG